MTDIARERRLLRAQGLDFLTREAWGAQSYTSDRDVFEPVEGFFLHISVTIDGGNTGGTEADDMRDIEAIGNDRFGGIGFPYNAAVFDTGRLYEGQPLTRRGAHTVNDENQPGFRNTGSGRSLNFWYRAIVLPQMVTDDVTEGQVDQCARWAAAQIRSGMAKPGATWHGHRDVSAKSCPGDTGYRRLPDIRRLTAFYVANGLQETDDMSAEDVAAIKAHVDDRISWVTDRLDHRRWSPESSGVYHTWARARGADEKAADILARVAAIESAVAQLGAGGEVDYARVEEAAEKAIRDVLGGLDNLPPAA